MLSSYRIFCLLIVCLLAISSPGCSSDEPGLEVSQNSSSSNAAIETEITPALQTVAVAVNGEDSPLNVSYNVLSEGDTTFVLVHGMGSDMSYWNAQVPQLTERGQVILIDLPGHGASDSPEIDYTLRFMASAVKSVLDQQGIDKGILIGHSLGVAISREFYRLYPESVEALIAIDGPLYHEESPAELREGVANWEGFGAFLEVVADSWFIEPIPAELAARIKGDMAVFPLHVSYSSANQLLSDPENMNEPITVPVLVVNAKGYAWGEDRWETMTASIAADLDFHFVEGAGHFVHMEAPEETNTFIAQFLDRVTASN